MGGSFSPGGRIALGATASGWPERRRLVNPRSLVLARSCGVSGRWWISLARFLRFPAGFPRGRFGGAPRPPGCSFLRGGFFDSLFCSSLPACLCRPPRGGTLPSRSVNSRDRGDHHGIGNKAVSRERDIGRGPLTRLWPRLISFHGMIGGVRGDVHDILHRAGNFSQNRFVLAHDASKGLMNRTNRRGACRFPPAP